MGSNLSVYNLGSLGVNVDKSPIHIEDGELTNAQNATKDPLGIVGGIVKRLGLAKFNTVAGAGIISGGISVPLTDGTTTAGTQTFYYGRMNNGGTAVATGWRTSTNAWTTGANISSGTPANPMGQDKAPGLYYLDGSYRAYFGHPGCIFGNKLYYAADDFTHNVTAPKIRVFDGVTDGELCALPYNPDVGAGTQSFGVITMASLGGAIYLTTLDGGSDDTNFRGRVFQLAPSTGQLIQLGSTIATGEVPYALTYYMNRIWLGTLHSIDATVVGKIYFFRPGIDTAWTLDASLPANICGVTAMTPYRGELYAACIANAATQGLVRKRDTTGAWSTVETGAGATIGKTNGYTCITEFLGNLYTVYVDTTGASAIKFRKFDGTTWSTVRTEANGRIYTTMYIYNNILYVGDGTAWPDFGAGVQSGLVSTTNGTSYTDRTSQLSQANCGVIGVIVT